MLAFFFGFYDQINWPFHYFFTAFFLVAAALFWWLDRKRGGDFRTEAQKLGLSYRATFDPGLSESLRGLRLLANTTIPEDTSMVVGEGEEHPSAMFDVNFRANGPTLARRFLLCFTTRVPERLPELLVVPESIDDTIRDMVGRERLYVANDWLNGHFRVACRDREFIDRLMSGEMPAFLQRHPTSVIEVRDRRILLAREVPFQPQTLAADMDAGVQMVGLLKGALDTPQRSAKKR